MAGNFTDYTENNVLNATLKGVAFPIPSNVYIGLFTAAPYSGSPPVTEGTPGNEVLTANWPAYARQDAGQGGGISSGWTAPSAGGVSTNAKSILFPANNGAGPITITHIALFDALTAGNCLYWAPLQASKTLGTTDVLSFAIGAITVTVD